MNNNHFPFAWQSLEQAKFFPSQPEASGTRSMARTRRSRSAYSLMTCADYRSSDRHRPEFENRLVLFQNGVGHEGRLDSSLRAGIRTETSPGHFLVVRLSLGHSATFANVTQKMNKLITSKINISIYQSRVETTDFHRCDGEVRIIRRNPSHLC